MEIFDSTYYSLNKYLLNILGLWPDLSKTRKNLSLIVFTLISFSLNIPILAGIVKAWGNDMVEVIENVTGTLYISTIYSKYLSAYLFQDRIKLVYIQTGIDWQSLTDKKELGILHQYSSEGKFLSIIYICYSFFAVIVFNSFPFVPLIMDTLIPINASRDRIYPYHPNYFVIDADKYFYELFIFHGSIVVAVITLAVAGIDSMMFANIKHSCGLFAIACYRLENIGKLISTDNNGNIKMIDKYEVLESVKGVCNMHRNSLKSVERLEHSFTISFLMVTFAGLLAIAMLMFDLLYSLKYPLRIMIILALLLGIKICLFFLNWIVQKIIDSSEEVFKSAYFSDWYNLSTEAQKFIFTILQKTMKPCALSAGSICDLNLQNFASVVKTSMSYATVMLSMQQTMEI